MPLVMSLLTLLASQYQCICTKIVYILISGLPSMFLLISKVSNPMNGTHHKFTRYYFKLTCPKCLYNNKVFFSFPSSVSMSCMFRSSRGTLLFSTARDANIVPTNNFVGRIYAQIKRSQRVCLHPTFPRKENVNN